MSFTEGWIYVLGRKLWDLSFFSLLSSFLVGFFGKKVLLQGPRVLLPKFTFGVWQALGVKESIFGLSEWLGVVGLNEGLI